MRACEADRCEAGATVGGRWCVRHSPGSAQEAPTEPLPDVWSWEYKWGTVEAHIADVAEELECWRGERVKVLQAMRESGMSLGDIAEVTGLTRQRIGQLLR